MYAIHLMFMSGAQDGLTQWLKDHEHQGYAIKDGWEFVLGRGKHCDLVIPYDAQISREHAILGIRSNALWLQDFESRNGTYIEEVRLSKNTALEQGQLFRIGHTWFRVQEFKV